MPIIRAQIDVSQKPKSYVSERVNKKGSLLSYWRVLARRSMPETSKSRGILTRKDEKMLQNTVQHCSNWIRYSRC